MKLYVKKNESETLLLDKGFTDVLRFVSCLLVAGSHYSQYCLNESIYNNLIIRLLSTGGGYLGVAIFFFLSGYGLTCSLKMRWKPFKTFIWGRIKKVYIPVVCVSLLWVVLLLVFPELQQHISGVNKNVAEGLVLKSLFDVFLFQFSDSVLWFISILLILNFLLYLYLLLKRSGRSIAPWAVLSVGTVVVMIYTRFRIGAFAVVSIPLFSIGALVAQYGKWIYVKRRSLVIVLLMAFAVLVLFFNNNLVFVHGLINYSIVVVLLWCVSNWIVRIEGLPDVVAGMSYDLYLTHKKILAVIAIFAPTMFLIMFLMLSTIVAYCFYHLRKLMKI